jgi:hypothetical protein
MLEHSSCLTEITDCASEFSSISNQMNRRVSGSRLSSRTIGSSRSTGRSSRRVKDQQVDHSKRTTSSDCQVRSVKLFTQVKTSHFDF